MPTAEETEIVLVEMEGDFPDEVHLVRRRLVEISEERPMHAWLREVVEALNAASNATTRMQETLGELVPGVREAVRITSEICDEKKKQTQIAEDEAGHRHEIQLRGVDIRTKLTEGAVTMGTTAVKHPVFWSAVSVLATWFAMTYGLPLPGVP